MKILTLNFKNEEPYLSFTDGEYSSIDNYVRECCEGNYHVEFTYKGIDCNENLVVIALTEYFNKQETPMKINDFHDMFSIHGKHTKDDEMTEIKRIVLQYLRNVLFEV